MACVVCEHARRTEIEAAAGEPAADLFEVAVRFGVNATRLGRHVEKHARADVTTASPAASEQPPAPKPQRRTVRRAPTPVANGLEDEPPATSRSAEISAPRPVRTAREKVERLVDSLQIIADKIALDDEATLESQLAAMKSLTGPLRLLGTFTGEIGASETTVASSPFYKRVRAAVVDALRAHPAAAGDVIAALERVERGEAKAEDAAA